MMRHLRHLKLGRSLLAALVLGVGLSGSFVGSPDGGIGLTLRGAEARVGRPLTPVSVAGVARRTTRRAVVGGAAVGAAAVGTACVPGTCQRSVCLPLIASLGFVQRARFLL
jgi:hypothetical protein